MGRPPKNEFPAPKHPKAIALALDGEVAAGLQQFVEQEQERLREEGEDWRNVTMNRVLNRAALLYFQNLKKHGHLPRDGETPKGKKK